MNKIKIKKLENQLISKVEIESEFVKEMLNLLDEFENIRRKQRMIEGKIKYLKNKSTTVPSTTSPMQLTSVPALSYPSM